MFCNSFVVIQILRTELIAWPILLCLRSENTILGPKNHVYGNLTKIDRLVANVTVVIGRPKGQKVQIWAIVVAF